LGNGPGGDGYQGDAETFTAFLEEKICAEGVPGLSVAVVKGDRVVWARGFGLADLATSTPATSQTGYLWFSMTKIATATAVVRLAEEGRLDLDAPADEYYRGFKVVSQPTPVSVRHLLGHSSGLADPIPIRWVYPASGPVPDRRAFVERLLAKNRKLRFAPGERASYSNLGYLVLGEVISEVSGMRYEEYERKEILVPLGMKRIGFSYPLLGGEPATGYHPLRPPLIPIFRAALPRGVVGHRQGRYVAFEPFYIKGPAYGGLIGGVADAARLVLLHLNGGQVGEMRLLSAASVAEMQRITPRGASVISVWAGSAPERPIRSDPLLSSTSAVVPASGTSCASTRRNLCLGVVMMGNTTGYDHESILDEAVRLTWE
jgi:CubicO group peptidase (beta-lactamase class C family)